MVKAIIKKLTGRTDGSETKAAFELNEKNRVSWLEKTLKALPAGGRILDAGAGELQFKKFCTHLNYVSQDFGKYNPEEYNSGLQMKSWEYGKLDHECDIASIPEADRSFDAIMCTEVFEHIIHPREAISEFSRLLRPGGFLVISAPFCSLTHFAPYHFYSGFSRFFYKTELESKGFEVVEISANGNYFDYLAQEIARIPAMAEKYAGKKVSSTESRFLSRSLQLMTELSMNNKNSEELLCFGFHVLARKKN